MKKLLALAILATLFISFNANASGKIAAVNVSQVVKESQAAQSIQQQAEEARSDLQEQVKEKESELRDQERDLAKQRSIISKEAFEAKTKEFQKKMIDAQKQLQAKGAKLQKAYEIAMEKVKTAMFSVIADIAKDKGYSIVLPRENMLYTIDESDISEDVIEALNDELGEVELNF